MEVRQFNIKGKYAEMFNTIKEIYVERLQKELGFELYISNNTVLERLIEEKYNDLIENVSKQSH